MAATDASVRRVAGAHLLALLATLAVLVLGSAPGPQVGDQGLGVLAFIGFAGLRVVSVNRRLALSTLILDALGTALLVAGTGAPASPFFFLALAGPWWSAHVPRPHSGLAWGVAFAVSYSVLVGPGAIAGGLLVHAIEDVSVVIIVGLLSDSFVRVDQRALDLSDALAKAPAGAEKLAIREGLIRVLGPLEISVDVLVAAGRAGLTVIQAELLAYLELGLTNQEIADATKVGEATVRYRLTRLYRALGVRGRKEAVRRASALGISSAPAMTPDASSNGG